MRKKDGLLVCLKIAGKDKSALVEAEFKILKPLAGRLAFITLPWKLGMATFSRFLMLPSSFSLLAAPSQGRLRSIKHPHIVQAFDYLETAASSILVPRPDAFGYLLGCF